MKFKFLTFAVSAALLTSCSIFSDDSSSDSDDVEGISSLSECSDKTSGNVIFNSEKSTVYYCNGKEWVSMDKLISSSDKNPISKDSVSKDSIVETDTLDLNLDAGCTVEKIKNGEGTTGIVISCAEADPDTVWNSVTAQTDGCTLVSDIDGVVIFDCDGKEVKLYKKWCGDTPYDPEVSSCGKDGNLYGMCGKKAYDKKELFCTEDEVLLPLCGKTVFDPDTGYCNDKRKVTKYGSVTDAFKTSYKTVVIGDQEWMAENLKTYKDNDTYNDHSWCPDNLKEKCKLYGRLYDWVITTDLAGSRTDFFKNFYGAFANPEQGICPDGWHLPTTKEWSTLLETVGGAKIAARYLVGSRYFISEGPNVDNEYMATNLYGFDVLFGQIFEDEDGKEDETESEHFWSLEQDRDAPTMGKEFVFTTGSNEVTNGWVSKKTGHFVRCIKGEAGYRPVY